MVVIQHCSARTGHRYTPCFAWNISYHKLIYNAGRHLFDLASQYLCTPVLLNTGLFKVDLLFVRFGERFEQLYGKKPVTPNMHFHCHLKERVIDCGPVHAFWFFSFERFNGRSEIQLLPKLLAGQFVWDVKFPSEFQENLLPFCFSQESHDLSKIFIMNNATELFNSAWCLNLGDFQLSDLTLLSLPSSFKHFALNPDELRLLFKCYKKEEI